MRRSHLEHGEAERKVLGGCLEHPEVIPDVMARLKPEDFYREPEQQVFAAIRQVFFEGRRPTLLTVDERLKQAGQNHSLAVYLDLTVPASVPEYVRLVKDCANFRRLWTCLVKAKGMVDEGLGSYRDIYRQTVNALISIEGDEEEKTFADFLLQWQQDMLGRREPDYLTGYADLDRYCEWEKGDVVVIGAQTSKGKTSLALNLAANFLSQSCKVLIFSQEMYGKHVAGRMAMKRIGMTSGRLKRRFVQPFSEMELANLRETTLSIIKERWPLEIDERRMSVWDIYSRCQRDLHSHPKAVCVVDYLQLTDSQEGENREQRIAAMSRQMKEMAKRLGILVILLSQLNRKVDQRGGEKQPELSDLRESGAIEQDADCVLLLHRPEERTVSATGEEVKYPTKTPTIIIAKNRRGALGREKFYFDDNFVSFEPLSREAL